MIRKPITVIQKELLTDGLSNGALLFMGFVSTFYKKTMLGTAIAGGLLIIMIMSLLLKKVKSDPWDEMTMAFYNEARRITLNTICIIIAIAGLLLLIMKKEIIISSNLIFVILGFVGLFQTITYIWIEHKNSVILEA
ncbi:hypothetical protein [Lacrimispora xylanolytica]|uniref:Membrane protein DUF2178 n=1 Tax=Lacrimispora xylanolytica TaxID=29375 RepID=A0ABY7A6Z5_9FIRM|nr:hypothetical protein [Lacrimispora xylanolytica]WAJ22088.1 hypothetical protein OW255_10885 [Lacrimispora xylanolytica]